MNLKENPSSSKPRDSLQTPCKLVTESVLGWEEGYTMKYTLSPREIPRAKPKGFIKLLKEVQNLINIFGCLNFLSSYCSSNLPPAASPSILGLSQQPKLHIVVVRWYLTCDMWQVKHMENVKSMPSAVCVIFSAGVKGYSWTYVLSYMCYLLQVCALSSAILSV